MQVKISKHAAFSKMLKNCIKQILQNQNVSIKRDFFLVENRI